MHSHSWQDMRNVIQSKLPFAIVDFASSEAKEECISSELYDSDYVEQERKLVDPESGNIQSKPSIFILGELSERGESPNRLMKRFDIDRMIIGEMGKDSPSVYSRGQSAILGKELLTSIDQDEMNDDYYQVGSMMYKFI